MAKNYFRSTVLLLSVLLAAFFGVARGTLGVDVSQPTSTSSFQCLKNSGYSFAVVRVYQSNGKVDPNGAQTIKNAWAGGMAHVDGYIFPCYSCGNPEAQMDATINALSSAGLKHFVSQNGTVSADMVGTTYGMLWLDVEGAEYWDSNKQNNVNFLTRMAAEGQKRGISLGVYTSAVQWSAIGGTSTALSGFPLWYPHYQSPPQPNYQDFAPFGGWSKPAIKQYTGTTSMCSASVDQNCY